MSLKKVNENRDLGFRENKGTDTKILTSKVQRPSQGFWGTWETGHLFQGNRGTKAKF